MLRTVYYPISFHYRYSSTNLDIEYYFIISRNIYPVYLFFNYFIIYYIYYINYIYYI